MLCKLALEGTGPARRLDIEFAERLNLITGDNGLGKSFLLDVAWWALTRTWPRANAQAMPREDAREAVIRATVQGKGRAIPREVPFDFQRQMWVQPQARPQMPGLVIYAQVDGGFSVWDPARNYWKGEGEDRPRAYLFDSGQVWTGLQEDGQWRCNGLYRDWASWQLQDNEAFGALKQALKALSPPGEELIPGPPRRISPDDSQDYPTIHMPYGMDVPLVYASAAIRRIIALAYLLIWAWFEHRQAAAQRREEPASRVILLIDEVEAHLHPSWQRRILPSLFSAMAALTTAAPNVQVIASTHSPLVCVSIEEFFDTNRDRLFDLDLDPEKGVTLEPSPFVHRGTSERWLASRHFDLATSYSEKAERALAGASELVKREMQKPGTVKRSEFSEQDRELRQVLADVDPFWVTWRRIGEKKGWLA